MSADVINSPSHYVAGRSIEPLDAIVDWGLDYLSGQVVKYISRAGRKGDAVEDLIKARFYLDRRIAQLNGDASKNGPRAAAAGVGVAGNDGKGFDVVCEHGCVLRTVGSGPR